MPGDLPRHHRRVPADRGGYVFLLHMRSQATGDFLPVSQCNHFPAHASPDSLARSPEPLTQGKSFTRRSHTSRTRKPPVTPHCQDRLRSSRPERVDPANATTMLGPGRITSTGCLIPDNPDRGHQPGQRDAEQTMLLARWIRHRAPVCVFDKHPARPDQVLQLVEFVAHQHRLLQQNEIRPAELILLQHRATPFATTAFRLAQRCPAVSVRVTCSYSENKAEPRSRRGRAAVIVPVNGDSHDEHPGKHGGTCAVQLAQFLSRQSATA